MVALLLYLHTKGVEAPYAATMAGVSGAIYFWGKVLTGKFIFTPMGALPRFVPACLVSFLARKLVGAKTPDEGTVAPMHLLFGELEGNGRYYGSDAKRSPLDKYRAPGSAPYNGP